MIYNYDFSKIDKERWKRDFVALLDACHKSHGKGAGGAAMCICGAGCGGSAACSALNILKIGLTSADDKFRKELCDSIGWY